MTVIEDIKKAKELLNKAVLPVGSVIYMQLGNCIYGIDLDLKKIVYLEELENDIENT